MSGCRVLCLGAGEGWHANQLLAAAADCGCQLRIATYESLHAAITSTGRQVQCDAGTVERL